MLDKDIESYVLKKGEEVSLIKSPNNRGKRILKKCKNCGCIFETLLLRARKKGEFFCSKKCYIEHMKKNSMTKEQKKKKEVLYQKKSKYGLNENDYTHMFDVQNNRCAICDSEFTENLKGFVDHCHKTNKIRGLLCTKCNSLLGMANDNIEILLKAIEYLKKYDKNNK